MGYQAPAIESLNNPVESYINSLELFKNSSQNNLSSEKQKTQNQTWQVISLIKPEFCEYKLDDIFFAAIQSIPASKEDTDQIFNCLRKKPGIDLGQVYVQQYMELFWDWIGSQITLVPPDSISFFLRIWLSFRDFTSLDKNAWKEFLDLPWNDSQKKETENFKLKHEFINKNSRCLQNIKLGEAVLDRNVPFCIKGQKELQRQYISQYRLLLKFTERFFKKIFESGWQELDKQNKSIKAINLPGEEDFLQGMSSFIQQMSVLVRKQEGALKLGRWERHFLNNFKKISYKIFVWRAKKMLPILQRALKKAVNELQNTNEVLRPIKEIQKNCVPFMEVGSKQDVFFKEELKQFELRNMRVEYLEKEVSSFELLSQSLLDSLVKQQQNKELTESQIALIEKNQRELIEEEEKVNSSQERLPTFLVSSDSDSEAEELVFPDNQPTTLLSVPIQPFAEMDAFLKNSDQVNGLLSKAIDGILKQLKEHLSKIQADHPNGLKAKKIYEIHAQLILATAALEQIMQAMQDRRWDHVVLGFRSTFIHCHFAMEQMLSLEILCKSGTITTTHNLNRLEKEAKISINTFKDKSELLKNIAMHLWFCYPADYRSFYPKSDYPKPFILLEKLFHPYKDAAGKNLDIKVLTEAVQECFTSYCQTIAFIAKVSSSPLENLDEFLEKIKKIPQKILAEIHKNKSPNKCLIESSISKKCKEALHIVEKINIPDFEEKHLLQQPLNTIKEYLQLMKISLQIPPKSNEHSLQEFLQVEVLANMDKLFKHLFRTIILLQTGRDNHSHNLLVLFELVENFYAEDVLTDQDKAILKNINLSITHHYLYKDSYATLQKKYKNFFDQSCKLKICSKKESVRVGKRTISYKDLEEQKRMIYTELELALDLFNKLLHPLVSELEELNVFVLKDV